MRAFYDLRHAFVTRLAEWQGASILFVFGLVLLMPSAIFGSAPRMSCRRATISCLYGCSSDARKASTLSGSDAPRFAGFLLAGFLLTAFEATSHSLGFSGDAGGFALSVPRWEARPSLR